MMVLGAVLYKGPGTASVAPRLIIGVVFVRLLLIPLLGMPLCDIMYLLQLLLFAGALGAYFAQHVRLHS